MKKVLPGQPLKISASTFNTMIESAADYQRRSVNRRQHSFPFDTKNGIVSVKNTSGQDGDRFSVLGISGVLVTPADNLQEFTSRITLTGVVPAAEHEGKFVVLLEPIKNGAFGQALVSGTTLVWLLGNSAIAAKTAGIQAGQTYLVPNASGAQILYEQPTTGVELHLALVRIPAGGGSGVGNASVAAATTANIDSIVKRLIPRKPLLQTLSRQWAG
jgi:hypothetical protein